MDDGDLLPHPEELLDVVRSRLRNGHDPVGAAERGRQRHPEIEQVLPFGELWKAHIGKVVHGHEGAASADRVADEVGEEIRIAAEVERKRESDLQQLEIEPAGKPPNAAHVVSAPAIVGGQRAVTKELEGEEAERGGLRTGQPFVEQGLEVAIDAGLGPHQRLRVDAKQ